MRFAIRPAADPEAVTNMVRSARSTAGREGESSVSSAVAAARDGWDRDRKRAVDWTGLDWTDRKMSVGQKLTHKVTERKSGIRSGQRHFEHADRVGGERWDD